LRGAGAGPQAADRVCARVARPLLGAFAPALVLLPRGERRRLETILAYARTLFDFARQPGPEGERLAMINRLEFDLESALAGAPPEQPLFLRLAAEEAYHPWPRPPLDRLAQHARRRSLKAPGTREEQEREAGELAAAILDGLIDREEGPTSFLTQKVLGFLVPRCAGKLGG
jgi:hypothetical protein